MASILSQKYGISGEGEIRWTLGTGRNTHTTLLSQEEYINNLISRFELQNATTVTTPLEPGAILTKDQCPTTPAELQDMFGNRYRDLTVSQQYVSPATRPDISFAIGELARFLVNPAQIHLDAALRDLRYLKGTKEWTLNLGGDVADIDGFTDWHGQTSQTRPPRVFGFPYRTYQNQKAQHGQMKPGLNHRATTLPPRGRRATPEAQRAPRHREISTGFVGTSDDSPSLWIPRDGSSFAFYLVKRTLTCHFWLNSSTPIAGSLANVGVATALRFRRGECRLAQLQKVLSEEVQRKLTELRMSINSTAGVCNT